MLAPIEVSNFRELIEYRTKDDQRFSFVDKSLLIGEILNDGSAVIMLTRPSRFGKTMNLSMLEHFLSAEVDGAPTQALFEGLKIQDHPRTIARHQGQHPVISVSFKDIKFDNFAHCLARVGKVMAQLYKKFHRLLYSDKIPSYKRPFIDKIIAGEASKVDLSNALEDLTQYLNIYFDKPVVLLIDDYDAPIQQTFSSGYYQEVISFFRNLLSAALKDNPHLAKGVLTGTVRVPLDDGFSGLNNVNVYNILHDKYASYFGFTESEVDELLTTANISVDRNVIKNWYNGYSFGDQLVYNPWSIINCIGESGRLSPYWINSSDNQLIKALLVESPPYTQAKVQQLMSGQVVNEMIEEYVMFDRLETNQNMLWTLLLMSGYLKGSNPQPRGLLLNVELSIPNQEVLAFYQYVIMAWLSAYRGSDWYNRFIEQLVSGDVVAFETDLQDLVENTFSFRDIDKKNGERFYHGVMLGLVAGLRGRYDIKSNRESGKGLFDAMLIPNDKTDNGIVFEFKVSSSENELEKTAKQALQQIIDKDYVKELKQQGVQHIIKIGIAFAGKQIKVVSGS